MDDLPNTSEDGETIQNTESEIETKDDTDEISTASDDTIAKSSGEQEDKEESGLAFSIKEKLVYNAFVYYLLKATIIFDKIGDFIVYLSRQIYKLLTKRRERLAKFHIMFYNSVYWLGYVVTDFVYFIGRVVYQYLCRTRVGYIVQKIPYHLTVKRFCSRINQKLYEKHPFTQERILWEKNLPFKQDIKTLIEVNRNSKRLKTIYTNVFTISIIFAVICSGIAYFISTRIFAEQIQSINVGLEGIPLEIRLWVLSVAPIFVTIGTVIVFSIIGFYLIFYMYIYLISGYRKRELGREADYMSSSVYIHMLTLSDGKMNIPQIVESISRWDDYYGELAKQFRDVDRKVKEQSIPLKTALDEKSTNTSAEEKFTRKLFSKMERTISSSNSNLTENLKGTMLSSLEETINTGYKRKNTRREFITEFYLTAVVFIVVGSVVIMLLGNLIGETINVTPILLGLSVLIVIIPLFISLFLSLVEKDMFIQQTTINKDIVKYENKTNYNKAFHEGYEISRLGPTVMKWLLYIKSNKKTPLEYLIKYPYIGLFITLPFTIAYISIIGVTSTTVMDVSVPTIVTLNQLAESPTSTYITHILVPFALLLSIPSIMTYKKSKREEELSIYIEEEFLSQFTTVMNQRDNTLQTPLRNLLRDDSITNDTVKSYVIEANNVLQETNSASIALIHLSNRLENEKFTLFTIAMLDIADKGKTLLDPMYRVEELLTLGPTSKQKRADKSSLLVVILLIYGIISMIVLLIDSQFIDGFLMEVDDLDNTGEDLGVANIDFDTDVLQAIFIVIYYNVAISIGLLIGKIRYNKPIIGIIYAVLLVLVSAAIYNILPEVLQLI